MHRILTILAALALSSALVSADDNNVSNPRNWAQWRGPLANGVAPEGSPPTEWSESENVRWKFKLPGMSHASPIVWGDHVFVQSAIKTDKPANQATPEGEKESDDDSGDERRGRGMRGAQITRYYRFVIQAIDRKTGKTAWERTLREEVPHEAGHPDASQASGSPITDGEHLYAYFGSRGLFCLTMNGEIVWEKNLGRMTTRNNFGEGGSPALHGEMLIVNWDHEGDSFIATFNKRTGEELWRKSRDEVTSWSTPLVVTDNGSPQVIVSASNRVRAYNLKSGDVVWQCGGLGLNCIPSPVAQNGTVYVMSGYRDRALLAIRYKGAKGDITETDRVAWKLDANTPYVPSPLLYDGTLYFIDRNSQMLACFDAKSGKEHYTKQRLSELTGVYASPVGAAGHVFVVGRDGVSYVLDHGSEFKVVSINRLDDGFDASPAIVDGEMYLRGREHLYCIAR